MEYGVLFIINENDMVIIDDFKVGDNDNLLVMVVVVVDVDVLMIFLDVDGFYNKNFNLYEDVVLFLEIESIDELIYVMVGCVISVVGIGGMKMKIEVVEKVILYGIIIFILNGFKEEIFNWLLEGDNLGIIFIFYEKLM